MTAKKTGPAKSRRKAGKATRHAPPEGPKAMVADEGASEHGGKRRASKKQHKRSRSLAEQQGLARRDHTISATPDFPSAVGAVEPLRIVDLQFRMWLALIRMSPLPLVLHQYATLSRAMMEFMLRR